MRALCLTIVPCSSRTNRLVLDAALLEESIHGVNTFGFSKVSELSLVVGNMVAA